MADAIRALLTTDPWELFFGIIEPTNLELTMELCSTFHLQTVMTNYDDPGTVQFCLGRLICQLSVPEFGVALGLYTDEFKEENELHALSRHIHFSPSNSHDYKEARKHWRRQHPRRLLLMVHIVRVRHQSCLFHRPCDSAPDGMASEGDHLHRPLRDSTGETLRAPQHRIIPHPHLLDVSIRHLEHA
ncbi:hypothetical protein GOBAR_AA26168 [Gossypium barbadense]|uniref:Uncharacterized protein n=1 Tax=Gossypium barbadense TaxID=3634 RepID=A0A2P5WTS4_GOSBA|nr:hypothetical protein GOBAR_AA26168 [Gossypium barbadense]